MSLSREWSWQDLAACSGKPLTLFFGDPKNECYDAEAKRRRENKAKAVCAGCKVQAECRDYALGRPEKHGIWAGMTEEERRAERRRVSRREQAAAKRREAA